MKISEALKQLLTEKSGANMSDLARACGVTPQAVQQWLTGTTTPRGGRLDALAKYFGMSSLEFTMYAASDGDMQGFLEAYGRPAVRYDPSTGAITESSNILDASVLERLTRQSPSHKSGIGRKKRDPTVLFESWLIKGPRPISSMKMPEIEAQALLGVRDLSLVGFTFVMDDTMTPTLPYGDLVFLDESLSSDKDIAEDGIYLIEYDGKLHIKRLQKLGERLAVKSDNPLYETWYVEQENVAKFRVLARAIRSMSMSMRVLG